MSVGQFRTVGRLRCRFTNAQQHSRVGVPAWSVDTLLHSWECQKTGGQLRKVLKGTQSVRLFTLRQWGFFFATARVSFAWAGGDPKERPRWRQVR
jgi:hypothetical protein